MAELLLELFSEEIPARMQVRASDDLKRLVTDKLKEAGLDWTRAEVHSTPRRLTLVIDGLPTAQPDVREERRGPRADAPEKAIEGFLNSAGLTRDQVETREEKRGTFLYAVIEKKGVATAEVISTVVKDSIREFPWSKSMGWGWGANLKWVRPLHRILCVFDGVAVPGALIHVNTEFVVAIGARYQLPRDNPEEVWFGNQTSGHRFMAPAMFEVADFADYKAQLQASRVVLDRAERAAMIEEGALALVKAQGLELVEDRALLDEVVGLVEWPVPLMGRFDEAFLDVPEEVLTATMRGNQKYFSVRDPKTGKLASHFVVVANMETADKGAAIVAGNERVLNARLADAKFFWDQDRRESLEARVPKLADMIFYEGLGTLEDKSGRVAELSAHIAKHYMTGVDAQLAGRAGELAKADLVTGLVGEFPEVQGIIGQYLALNERLDPSLALAIAEHYSPVGPKDECPSEPISVAVALADKIDTVVAFFSKGLKPTGSKDPFALRRAALGAIRLVVENNLRIPLLKLFEKADSQLPYSQEGWDGKLEANDLLDFFADRLKVQQREQGVCHDLIDAVFSLGGEDDLVRLLNRVEALSKFLATDDGANLLAGFKRATNIVRIEEKKDGTTYAGDVKPDLLTEADEKALHAALETAAGEARTKVDAEDFEGAMAAMAALRAPVDAFFDNVTVNFKENEEIRENRLKLLSRFGAALGAVADFSKIEG